MSLYLAAKLRAEAAGIEHQAKLETQNMVRSGELSYLRGRNDLELYKKKEMANIEISKFQEMVESIGPDTCAAMARAGPETQVKLLQALGMKSVLLTDGNTPINLFDTAAGLVSQKSGNSKQTV